MILACLTLILVVSFGRATIADDPSIALLRFGEAEEENDEDVGQTAHWLASGLGTLGAVTDLGDGTAAPPDFARFDLVVLWNPEYVPWPVIQAIRPYLDRGGALVLLGGPPFRCPLHRANDHWLPWDPYAGQRSRDVAAAWTTDALIDFDSERLSAWMRTSGDKSVSSSFERSDDDRGPGTGSARLTAATIHRWEARVSPPLKSPPRPGYPITTFWAKGNANTPQCSIEWRERDRSRWYATIELGTEWRFYALRPEDFTFTPDSPAVGRGTEGDHFRPSEAERVALGFAFLGNDFPRHGPFEVWFDDLGCAPPSDDLALLDQFRSPPPLLPTIEGVSPPRKFYPISGDAALRLTDVARAWIGRVEHDGAGVRIDAPTPPHAYSHHPRPGGSGFDKKRPWRMISLLDYHRDGKVVGSGASLLLHANDTQRGGAVLTIPIAETAFFEQSAVRRLVLEAVARLLDGVFFVEAGTARYASFGNEQMPLGATVVNRSGRPRSLRIETAITRREQSANTDRAKLYADSQSVSVAAANRHTIKGTWHVPAESDSSGFNVTVRLLEADRMIDSIEHELLIWQPRRPQRWITRRDGHFYFDLSRGEPNDGDSSNVHSGAEEANPNAPDADPGPPSNSARRWIAHGVNYMPSSGTALDNTRLFEYWLGSASYDPAIITRDLDDIQRLGLNMISVFIYHHNRDMGNLIDLLARCQRRGLLVNLSLRPGTPMEFPWWAVRRTIQRNRLAENDTVFAYDLAWEPTWRDREKYDPQWREWLIKRHGSVEQAERHWGCPVERGADGQPTGPADRQFQHDGPWKPMVLDYRRFLNELLAQRYGEARRLVRTIAPRQLVSFRMSMAGDPTRNPARLVYDPAGLANAVDIMEPEGYGRRGDWEQVRPGWFTVAYCRAVAPHLPVLWSEFGLNIRTRPNWANTGRLTWTTDDQLNEHRRRRLRDQARFFNDFYKMAYYSDSDGTICWYLPGGIRGVHPQAQSDFGVLNPDRSLRPVSRVIQRWGPVLMNPQRPPKPVVSIPIEPEAHVDGIHGVYEQVKDAFYSAIDADKSPRLVAPR